MKVLICGSRSINFRPKLLEAVNKSGFEITEIISGGARGVDTLAENYAKENNIPFHLFPALWDIHGRAAGPIRNEQMVEFADAVIAIWTGTSTGTRSTIRYTKRAGKPLFELVVPYGKAAQLGSW